jgi:hypothetical protein
MKPAPTAPRDPELPSDAFLCQAVRRVVAIPDRYSIACEPSLDSIDNKYLGFAVSMPEQLDPDEDPRVVLDEMLRTLSANVVNIGGANKMALSSEVGQFGFQILRTNLEEQESTLQLVQSVEALNEQAAALQRAQGLNAYESIVSAAWTAMIEAFGSRELLFNVSIQAHDGQYWATGIAFMNGVKAREMMRGHPGWQVTSRELRSVDEHHCNYLIAFPITELT